MNALLEPGSLVMERKMLIGIKQRAERLAAESVRRSRHRQEAGTGAAVVAPPGGEPVDAVGRVASQRRPWW